ncbi:MAG: hypothetical protein J7L44_03895 [Candidatus Diapherotrites archaeon]|nr:hypothetical protein [Candidatus Diapherotrites archaeon]
MISYFSPLYYLDHLEEKYKSRHAYQKVFYELEKLPVDEKNKLTLKMEEISRIKVTPYNTSELNNRLTEVFESPEFNRLRRLLESIPKNQQKKFLIDLLSRLDSTIIAARSYLSSSAISPRDYKDVNVLDQAFYQSHLIVRGLMNELQRGKPNLGRVNTLILALFILTVKISGLIKGKIKSEELLEVISLFDSKIKIEGREEFKEYLLALTN